MKKHLLIILLIFVPIVVFCQDLLNPTMYRVNDFTNQITDASQDKLNEDYNYFVQMRKCDFPVCFVKSSDISIDEYGQLFFEQNEFGYGVNREGIVLVVYTKTKEVKISGFGGRLNDVDYSQVEQSVLTRLNKNYTHYAIALTYLVDIMKYHKTLVPNPFEDYYTTTTIKEIKKEGLFNKPDWYPKDISAFQDFHDYNAPRVVDNANIFSEEEKAIMLREIKKVQDDYNVDLVVFTDTDSYGLSHATYSADFHHFNGYGYDADFVGSVLFICMNPEHRGWWTSATGWIEDIYNSSVVNSLDDQLEPYMKSGNYGVGVIDYIKNVHDLYKLPSWYPKNPQNFVRTHKKNPRLIDNANYFTEDQKQEIESILLKASQDCTADIVVLTGTERLYGSSFKYAQAYYYYNGYGVGPEYDGCLLYMGIYNGKPEFYGIAVSKYGQFKENKGYIIASNFVDDYFENKPIKAVKKFAKITIDYFNGKEIQEPKPIDLYIIISIIVGIISGFISAGIKKSKMKTVLQAGEAHNYLVDGSFKLRSSYDQFLRKTETRVRKSSSSGGSGGGGYRSSGGRSYSGGGRSF